MYIVLLLVPNTYGMRLSITGAHDLARLQTCIIQLVFLFLPLRGMDRLVGTLYYMEMSLMTTGFL